jgi:ribonuclease PH
MVCAHTLSSACRRVPSAPVCSRFSNSVMSRAGRAAEEVRPVRAHHSSNPCCYGPLSPSPHSSRPTHPTVVNCCLCRFLLDASLGAAAHAEGSAYVECGSSKAVAASFAPRQARTADGFSDAARLEVDARAARFANSPSSRDELSDLCQAPLDASVSLSNLPKAVVDASATVLDSDGADVSVALAALSLSLAHAGSPSWMSYQHLRMLSRNEQI